MLISIITVVKNDFRNIEKTINSVYSQNYKNIEYIVIDGNSSDRTLNKIKQNKFKISKIISAKDKNLYEAINKGIKISRGKIISLIHSGDIYLNKFTVKTSMEVLIKKKLDFVISDLKIVNKNLKTYRFVKTSRFFKPYMLAFGVQPPHPTLFIKKELVKKLNYYSTDYRIVGDFDFFCKLFKENFKWQNIPLVSVLQKRGGLSDGKIIDKFKMSIDMAKILKKNKIFSIKIFFIIKFLIRIKEFFFKK